MTHLELVGVSADNRADLLAVLEEDERRHGLDANLGSNLLRSRRHRRVSTCICDASKRMIQTSCASTSHLKKPMFGNDDSSFSKTGPMTLLFVADQESVCQYLSLTIKARDCRLTKVRTCATQE